MRTLDLALVTGGKLYSNINGNSQVYKKSKNTFLPFFTTPAGMILHFTGFLAAQLIQHLVIKSYS